MHPVDKVSSKLAAGAPKRERNKVSGGFSLPPLCLWETKCLVSLLNWASVSGSPFENPVFTSHFYG